MSTARGFDATVSQLVRDAPVPLMLIDMATREISEVSEPLLELIAQERPRVVGHLVTSHSAEASSTAAMLDRVAEGELDGYQASRKIRRGDGEVIGVTIWVRVVDPDAGRTSVLALFASGPERDDVPASSVNGPTVIGVVDTDWRVVTISNDIEALVGIPPEQLLGQGSFDGVHRSDHADLLFGVSTLLAEQRGTTVRLRVRHADGRWIRVSLRLSLITGERDRAYGFAMAPAPDRSAETPHLEDHLRRIALEVRAAGIGRVFQDDAPIGSIPGVERLSNRQVEILTLLFEGARVPSIARRLYVSQSTVRNHLAVIFDRLGVRSQVELLERYGRTARDASSRER